ncbi:unnamed protein product [Kuraishia capsulata CBS 1993]|uniref:Tetrapyrrole biosynthesis uroporphyrinogen III synthase domain-containing protein n=1 Tax=Kuraishia capsulata CBS 1993 TaxID=1382522 RepID=W6MMG0_9ASCO|nr:uncharacterized protein KUCA_T00003366001 [Kuraishia capsulata CBS 1993]CDK27388.1 unnamed protein product [Kuraishia capsulata CBS 1993]
MSLSPAKGTVLFLKNKTVPSDPYELQFEKQGYHTSFIPLLNHEHLNKQDICAYLTSAEFLQHTKALIITSQRAVEALDDSLRLLSEKEPHGVLQLILQKPSYTVGPATAEVLSRIGFSDIRGGIDAGNGSLLADLIIEDKLFSNLSEAEKKIVFFTGETRKDTLPKKLLASNFQLKEEVIYRTVTMSDAHERFKRAFEESSRFDSRWIIFFSPQGTEIITKSLLELQDTVQGLNIASIGPTTESYLLDIGLRPNVVSFKPEALSLLESINMYGA